MESITKRISYIDALKGVGILLVMLGHNSFNDYLTYFIYFFHMPLFFFISGYLTKSDAGLKDVVKKKINTLVYPYCVFGCIVIVYNTLFDMLRGISTVEKFVKRIIAFLYGNLIWENNSDYIGTLWFLVCLFCTVIVAETILYIAQRRRYMLYCMCFISFLLGWGSVLLKNNYNVRLPWCLDVSFIAVLFYIAGYLYRMKQKKCSNRVDLIYILFGILGGVINTYYMKMSDYQMLRVDMLNMNYGVVPIFIVSATFISIGMIGIFKEITSKGFELKVWSYLGQLSMVIMIVHIYVNQIIMLVLNYLGLNKWIISFPICTMISIIVAIFLHNKLPILEDFRILRKVGEK